MAIPFQFVLAITMEAYWWHRCGIQAPLNMERVLKDWMWLLSIAILYLSAGTSFFAHCVAGGPSEQSTTKNSMKVKIVNHLDSGSTLDKPYKDVGSPFTLPPYDDVMGSPSPSSPPQVNPVYCVYPPPQPPTTTSPPSPTTIYPSPPPPSPPSSYSSPTTPNPSPPSYSPPTPKTGPSPPSYEPSPPGPITNPPIIVNPSPPLFVPGPPIFQPPVVYPPPSGPPPSPAGTSYSLWCVAKPSVPDPIIQEAMDYACGSGADCDSIQPNGSCYEPHTLIAHASFAFNSYWQRTRVVGGTCDFGGTAMLVTRDPSFDGCHFLRA